MIQIGTQESGFTIVELIITIVIASILAVLVVVSPKAFLVSARDQERGDDTAAIMRQLEQAYESQSLGYPAYPSTAELATDITNDTRTIGRLRPEALQAPGGNVNSVVMATSTSTTNPAGTNTPSLAQYVYQPLTSSGTLCTGNPSSGNPCVRFFLYYRNEATNVVKSLKSIRQQ